MRTPRRRAPRMTDRVAAGLNAIYSFMDNEHCVRQWSAIECTCKGCRGIPKDDGTCDTDDCHCYGKPRAKQCEECRLYHDLGEALSWLGQMIDRHEPK